MLEYGYTDYVDSMCEIIINVSKIIINVMIFEAYVVHVRSYMYRIVL